MLMQPQSLDDLSAQQLREMTTRLLTELRHSQALCAKLTHENALLKRMKFAAQSERFNAEQRSLLDDEMEADLAAVCLEIEQLQPPAWRLNNSSRLRRLPRPNNSPNARACQPICRGARSATSRKGRSASAAAR